MPYLWRKALCVVLRRTIRPGNITSTFMDSLSNTLVDFFSFVFRRLWFMNHDSCMQNETSTWFCIPKPCQCVYQKQPYAVLHAIGRVDMGKKKKESERAPVRKVCFLHFCVKPSEFTCGGLDCQNIYIYYLMRAAVNENVIETTAASSASWWTTHGHFWYDPLMMFTFWDR